MKCRVALGHEKSYNFHTVSVSRGNGIPNFMQQNPYWEADSRSFSQRIARLLYNSKVHCRIYKSQSLSPILRQMNSVHMFLSHFH